MTVVAVVHHLDQPFLGHVAPPLRAAGIELDERHRARGDALPDLAAVDGIISLGGNESAVHAEEHPRLREEVALLREAVAAGTPLLGICLGGQLLAQALGGTVRHVGRRVEWRSLRKLPAADGDPLLGAAAEPVPALHFNEDVFDAPPGSDVLLTPAPAGAAAFRAGARAWGLQFHPDADDAVVARWITEYAHEIPDVEAFRAQTEHWTPAQREASRRLFTAFAQVVAQG